MYRRPRPVDRPICADVHDGICALDEYQIHRISSHSALMTKVQEIAMLWIFLLSQTSVLAIQWSAANDMELGILAVTPALVKHTDEHRKNWVIPPANA